MHGQGAMINKRGNERRGVWNKGVKIKWLDEDEVYPTGPNSHKRKNSQDKFALGSLSTIQAESSGGDFSAKKKI